ncbi:hypothetical protein Tco_0122641 [Tanacetum coccineum]
MKLCGGTEVQFNEGPVRARVLNDLSAEEKERYKADIRATNILLQGIPKDIYSLINHYTDAKDIWENVKMILEGSELTKESRESSSSSNARKNAMVQYWESCVQDVRGRYNANNQGRPFQRNNARGNGVAGNVGGQNRGGMINPGQAKPINDDSTENDLALNVDHIFEVDECDASTLMLMRVLPSPDHVHGKSYIRRYNHDEARTSYDSN